jgi:hypothetical protein
MSRVRWVSTRVHSTAPEKKSKKQPVGAQSNLTEIILSAEEQAEYSNHCIFEATVSALIRIIYRRQRSRRILSATLCPGPKKYIHFREYDILLQAAVLERRLHAIDRDHTNYSLSTGRCLIPLPKPDSAVELISLWTVS